MTSRPSNWLYDERRLREVGGADEGPLRLAIPTLEGEEPERDRGGVCTDIMADRKYTAVIELRRDETHCQESCYTSCAAQWVKINVGIRDYYIF